MGFKLGVLSKAIFEGRQLLGCSELVKIGRNCVIDPHAVIHGPTTIGDNVSINAGAVIVAPAGAVRGIEAVTRLAILAVRLGAEG